MHSKGFTLIELMIVIMIIGILAAIFIPAYQRSKDPSNQETGVGIGVRLNIDSRPSDGQVQWQDNVPNSNVAQPDSENEICLAGISYWLVTRNGQNFMSPKQNRYGDNETC